MPTIKHDLTPLVLFFKQEFACDEQQASRLAVLARRQAEDQARGLICDEISPGDPARAAGLLDSFRAAQAALQCMKVTT